MTSSLVSVRFNSFLALCLWVLAACFGVAAATLPAGFTETPVATGLSAPTAMAFAPDGRLFICQQGGALRIVKNGALLATPFLSLSVDSSGERGLLGIAFDPNFTTNNFIYLYYTSSASPRRNRVSRFTANGDVAVAGSEVVILTLETLSATNHNGGAIHFGPDGKLYVAVGENAVSSNSQTLTNRLGKMLRLNSDGSIPSDNPFFNTASGDNRAIWSLGLRNPFTFAFQPNTGRMFINDVGQSTWEEINDGIAGANYGWPNTEGPTNNPNFQSPIFAYGRTPSDTGGCAITGGTFYNPSTSQFPSSYVGKYFFADLCNGWIRVLDPTNSTATGFATGISNPVDLRVGPDGSLYYLSYGSGSAVRIQAASQGPTITSDPSNQTVLEGQSATFQVVATGTGPLSYQWQRSGANIPSANSASYTVSNATLDFDGDTFRCVVSNAFGSAISREATLTVNAPAGITTPPTNQTVAAGQPATFQILASGSTPLSYQWQRNTVNISGANSPSYTLASATFADNGAKFRCVVSNAFGSATSIEATLTVNAPPEITTPPTDQTVAAGLPATFQVVASGSPTLSYQWQRNTVNISGANSPSYILASATFADNGAKFRCVVSNAFGTAISLEASLTVNAPPEITTPPTDQTVAAGLPATFQVVANGSATLSYQWQRNTVNISGANSPSYTLASATFADNGAKFRCVVSNAFGTATSIEATLTVNAAPDITTEPTDQTVTQGLPVTFQVVASGSTPLSYQWQRNTVNISGANSPSYTIPTATLADHGAKFRCVVSNAFGTDTSIEATLTVTHQPPILFTEEGTDRAIAFDSVTMARDPFALNTFLNFSADHRTRIMLLASGANLLLGENSSAVTAQAEDSLLMVYPLTVEFVGKVPGFDSLDQIVVKLPESFAGNGDVLISITLRGATSNKVRIRIQ